MNTYNYHILYIVMIYALLLQDFVVAIDAIFPQWLGRKGASAIFVCLLVLCLQRNQLSQNTRSCLPGNNMVKEGLPSDSVPHP